MKPLKRFLRSRSTNSSINDSQEVEKQTETFSPRNKTVARGVIIRDKSVPDENTVQVTNAAEDYDCVNERSSRRESVLITKRLFSNNNADTLNCDSISDLDDGSSIDDIPEKDESPLLRFYDNKRRQQNKSASTDFCVQSLEEADFGRASLVLAKLEVPGLVKLIKSMIEEDVKIDQARIIGCTRITSYTAIMIEALVLLGAQVRWCSSNLYSTQNEIAAYLAENNIPVFAWEGMTEEEYWWCLKQVIEGKHQSPKERFLNTNQQWQPNLILDECGDLISMLCKYPEKCLNIKGIVGDGHLTASSMHNLVRESQLMGPAFNLNQSIVKRLFYNKYLPREAIIDALKRSMDFGIGGKKICILGYGSVGKACASTLSKLGGNINVTEIDPICALQAKLDGFNVIKLEEAIRDLDLLLCCTGNVSVVKRDHLDQMKNGSVLCNMGHDKSEIDLVHKDLSWQRVRPHLDHLVWPKERKRIKVINKGRNVSDYLTPLPPIYTSVVSSLQILSLIEFFTCPGNKYEKYVYRPAMRIDEKVARFHLESMNGDLTSLTEEQENFIGVQRNGPFKPVNYNY